MQDIVAKVVPGILEGKTCSLILCMLGFLSQLIFLLITIVLSFHTTKSEFMNVFLSSFVGSFHSLCSLVEVCSERVLIAEFATPLQ